MDYFEAAALWRLAKASAPTNIGQQLQHELQEVIIRPIADTDTDTDLDGVLSAINVTKPFKYRKLKTDPASRLARKLYKLRSRNPEFKRKRNLYSKKYKLKNKQSLKRRAEFVRKAKDRLPDPPSTPRVENK